MVKPKKKIAKKVPSKTFARKRAVTLPNLKWENDVTLFIRFDSEIEVRKTVDPKDGEERDIEVAKVTNLVDESQYDLVCGTVLSKEMAIAYPTKEYIGMSFELTKKKVEGKRYRTFEIYELEV